MTARDALLVIVPAGKAEPDGWAFADASPLLDNDWLDGILRPHQADFPVRVVPASALRAFLQKSASLGSFERRFEKVSQDARAQLLGLFALIEAVRAGDPQKYKQKRNEYLGFMLAKRPLLRKKSRPKHEGEIEGLKQFFYGHERGILEKKGERKVLAQALSDMGSLRLWWSDEDGTLCPGLLADDFTSSLFVHLCLSLSDSEGLAICGACEKKYRRTKTTQVYCSPKCGNRKRKAKQRAKEKQHGTRKKR